MSIDRIELHRLRVPLTTPYKLAFGPVSYFDTVLVELHDSAGNSGLGEATPLTGYTDETLDSVWAFVLAMAPQLPGRDATDVERLLEPHFAADPFAATALLSAAEMLAGSPWLQVAEPTRVPLLGLLNATGRTEIRDEVEVLLARGYRTLKVKVGFDASADAERVQWIQQFLAGRAALRLDANQGYDRESACRFASALSPQGIELFEQPCAADDWDAALAVAKVCKVPMMLDESIYGSADIRRAADLQAARFIKLKLMKLGGLTRLAQGLNLIRSLGMEPVLGNGVACEIGCWMEACVARTTIRNAGEMNGFLKPRVGLLTEPLEVESGAMVLTPGFQPQLDRAALAKVRTAHETYR